MLHRARLNEKSRRNKEVRKSILIGFFFLALMMVGCAAGPIQPLTRPTLTAHCRILARALAWDYLSLPLSSSLYSRSNVHIYEVHNNGGWYNFGFVVRAGILFGGSGKSS